MTPHSAALDTVGYATADGALYSLMRIRFSKHGKIRFTSHRDVARIWERTLRRVSAPLVYSAGFSPRPRISFGLALPTGYESDAEYLDIRLDPSRPWPEDGECAAGILTSALPSGMAVTAVSPIDRGKPSLQNEVTSCTWRIDVIGAPERDVSDAIGCALDASELFVERVRKGRSVVDDIRPSLIAARIEHRQPIKPRRSDSTRIIADLGTQPRSTRPAELISSLSPQLQAFRVRRLHQWIATNTDRRREPLTAISVSAVAEPGIAE